MSADTDIECPACGHMAPVELVRCPNCGRSFYPEDEPAPPLRKPAGAAGAGLVRRVLTGVVVGGLLGGGLSLAVGPGWVWLVLAGALLLGIGGWAWEHWG